MTILHIEHAITDYDLWRAAFERLADARTQAGVRAHRVHRSVDNPHYIAIDLDFDNPDHARRFRTFLQTTVWSTPENAPALRGEPHTVLLEPAPRPSAA